MSALSPYLGLVIYQGDCLADHPSWRARAERLTVHYCSNAEDSGYLQ